MIKYLHIFLASFMLVSLPNLAQNRINKSNQTKASKPNVIVILADDLGYADVGFNRATNTDVFPADRGIIPTPNIDALANNGIICKNAHVAHPFCGPSRAALLTGVYPHRIGAQYNLPNDITSTLGIPTNETFFPQLIQKDGSGNKLYNTAAFGKWHLGFVEGSYQPLDRGFDHFFGFLGGGKNYTREAYDKIWY
ncbi:sulfatase-like hydrolase/transferase [Flavobacterium algicola]|uniref:sulfatase-like hydrolase/transferase n=1 Tax=Flavobacterium algicola TaxID=556529 RepID=UPI001EFC9D48|nr:sulfatase-like hydrolase/transferase [Flavobacterium algicola]MCG9793739.1 sulfatase-like hydrolase/transferase [Flavobacterium algicola]